MSADRVSHLASRRIHRDTPRMSQNEGTPDRRRSSTTHVPPVKSMTLRGDYDKIILESASYTDRPEAGQKWLRSFGDLHSGTDVSTNLIGFIKTNNYNTEEQPKARSLLPVLSGWLSAWFKRTVSARKAVKTQGNGDSALKKAVLQQEEDNLAWLFNYLFVYLDLKHEELDSEEVVELCNSLLAVCQATTRHQDIEEATKVIYVIILRWPSCVTNDSVEQMLQVMCNTRAALSRGLPSHLVSCISLLVNSDMRDEVIKRLYDFITAVAEKDHETEKKASSLARGSVLFLGDIMDNNKEGDYAVKFEELIDPMLTASKTMVVRLCTDILDLCDHMLLHDQMKERILQSPRYEDFIVLVWNCSLEARRKARNTQSGEQNPKLHESTEEYLRKNEASGFRMKQTLVRTWLERNLTLIQRGAIFTFFMNTSDDMDDSMLMLMLYFVHDEKLCWPRHLDCERVIDTVLEHVLRRPKISSIIRCKAVEILSESIIDKTDIMELDPELSSFERNIVRRLGDHMERNIVIAFLDQIDREQDHEVLRQLSNSLENAFFNTWKWENLNETTVERLESFILKPHHTGSSPNPAAIMTSCLIGILLKGYSYQEKLADQAFQAILKIASPKCPVTEARLVAMRFLFRLRCSSTGCIYVQTASESDYIATALCRTRESADAFLFNDTISERQRKSGSSTSLSNPANKLYSPLWMYPETEKEPEDLRFRYKVTAPGYTWVPEARHATLDVASWLYCLADCLQRDQDWETYSYLIVHSGAQLANTTLFSGTNSLLETVVHFRKVLCERINGGRIYKPPAETGLKDSDVAICLFNILTSLIPYATMKAGPIQKGFADELVRTFLTGVGGLWEGTSRGCIHSLSICSLELPESIASLYIHIVDKMSKCMSQSHLTMHILEFLAQVARLPEVHSNFRDEEIVMIFSICIQFLEKAREKQMTSTTTAPPRIGTPASRQSGISSKRPPYRAAMQVDIGLSHYTSALAYHTMIFWFLSLNLSVRKNSIPWIIPRLIWKDSKGEEMIDEQSMVLIDMMQRVAYSDHGETKAHPDFATPEDGKVSSANWVYMQSIVTIETAGHSGLTQVTKRQASGTSHIMWQQYTAPLPSHHVKPTTQIRPEDDDGANTIDMLPPHVLLQLVSTADPTSLRKQPVLLPKAPWVTRAIESFDRIVTVDSHKIGILYIGDGQTEEKDYLANTHGTSDFESFLSALGTRVSLSPPLDFNPQGLRLPIDGTETYAWRDRVTEIVYHIPTMMPTNITDDPASTQKKSHVGNCHVNIIFNRSALPWFFTNFRSQLNYVNIVITPANLSQPLNSASDEDPFGNNDFYRVYVLTKDAFPHISPAADPKIISKAQLPQFVRMIALNANVFCEAWNSKDSDTEFPSNWRARLQEIKRLRERVCSKEKGSLVQQLDFSGWTLEKE